MKDMATHSRSRRGFIRLCPPSQAPLSPAVPARPRRHSRVRNSMLGRSTGDFALMASEVNPVAGALRANGIDVSASHQHHLNEQPRLFYLHFWANGDLVTLAQGLHAALDQTNSAAVQAPVAMVGN